MEGKRLVWAPRSGRTRSKQSYTCGFMPAPLTAGACTRSRLCGVLCPVDVWCLPLLKPPGCGGRGLHLGDLISPNHFPKARPLHIMGGLSFHPHNPSNKGLWGLNPSGEGTVFTRKQVPGWGGLSLGLCSSTHPRRCEVPSSATVSTFKSLPCA